MSRPSRLLTAYFVTAQVTLSYVGLVLSRRFRSAESYQRALKLDPNNKTAQNKLALAREISAKLRAVR